MAKPTDIAKAVNEKEIKPAAVQTGLESLLKTANIRGRFDDMLGKKSAGFISSILSAVASNAYLKQCDAMSVISSAAVAASLDLPINPSLGFAHIVPYSGKAQFQMGWRGYVQLAMRTGQYKTIHVSEVYEDELKNWNPITSEIDFTHNDGWKQRETGETAKIVGYVAFFMLLNGFVKYQYMTKAQVERHGKRYSKSYGNDNGKWKLDFDAMAKKTVLKMLLNRYGILSIEMQTALHTDQAVIKEDGTPEFIDNPENVVIDAEIQAQKKEEEIPFGEPNK